MEDTEQEMTRRRRARRRMARMRGGRGAEADGNGGSCQNAAVVTEPMERQLDVYIADG